ncbi:EexN family lipoprotein [Phenylobacterium sp. LjRoot225]|uniref:EexN family lipoprotein n=1 Tax=Phenylobacterium sp. LjRoot225 TaxID=3342285 RepID=UPI003F4FD630
MRPAIILTALLAASAALSACQREPRSERYFEANPNVRAEVIADCKQGTHRGAECQFAQRAAETAANRKTMEDYRSGF